MRERHLHLVKPDPESMRVQQMTARAARAGYLLTRSPAEPRVWSLLDASDGERVYSALTIDRIEQWLNE
ncbi:hypothetical protein AB0E01_05965 [Nocardia vinacea]|uniref:hypothetical protein n=1 Tax=Nocardia vinacea TaxID=96468 RepID=UPI00340D0864